MIPFSSFSLSVNNVTALSNSKSFDLHISRSACVCMWTDCSCSNTEAGTAPDILLLILSSLLRLFSGLLGEFNPLELDFGVFKGLAGNGSDRSLLIGADNDSIANCNGAEIWCDNQWAARPKCIFSSLEPASDGAKQIRGTYVYAYICYCNQSSFKNQCS